MDKLYCSGPVVLKVTAPVEWCDQVADVLDLYTFHWDECHSPITVHLHASAQRTEMGAGRFLFCTNMRVDKTRTGLAATCRSGASGNFDAVREHWDLYMPTRARTRDEEPSAELFDDNLEDLLELVLTTAWRQAGWIPIHAGAVVKADRCAILMGPSKGGKTTLAVAMLHRGWNTLGDDKLLLKLDAEGRAELRSLEHHFNIDPRTRQWFSEIGDLSDLPLDSVWTAKRRVPIESIWQERVLARAQPTHLVQLQRFPAQRATTVEGLDAGQVFSTLLRQTAVPSDPGAAKQILSVVASTAGQLRGLRLEVGEDAYDDPQTLDVLEQSLA